MSAGIVESGILLGFGKSIARRIHEPKKQIIALSLSIALISAFMNNVGAIRVILPTAKRMAHRAGIEKANFGMPLVYAVILGGSVTLIGTASSLIVSTFRFQAFGQPFKMFDFAAHGLAMVGSGLIVLFVCQACGFSPTKQKVAENEMHTLAKESILLEPAAKSSPKKTTIVLISLIPVMFLTSIGLIHPAVGFGFVVLFWILTSILSLKNAYENINIPLILFLGSMLSISDILNDTGALQAVVGLILPMFSSLPHYLLILIIIFVSALFANVVDSSVAAVLISPLVIQLYKTGAVDVSADALLMAVAAGASLGIVLPTDQAVIVAMESTGFSRMSFIKTGAVVALTAGIFAALAISIVWQ
jgi:di/tricarboxylate transporter